MLQDARRQRQRVLDAAFLESAALRTAPRSDAPQSELPREVSPQSTATVPTSTEQAAQTDLVTIFSPGSPAPAPHGRACGPCMPPIDEDGCGAFLSASSQRSRTGSPARRDQQQHRDDEAQAEALQTLRSLAAVPQAEGASSPFLTGGTNGAAKDIEAELHKEKGARKELELRLAGVVEKTQATQEQVLCLEQELDDKDEALHRAEKALDARNAELQQAQHSLAQLRVELLATQQLLMKTTTDRDIQLSHKHQYIQSFFEMIKQQQGSVLEGEQSTAASSDRESDADRGSDRGSHSLDSSRRSAQGGHSLDSSFRSELGSSSSCQSFRLYAPRSSA